MILRGQKAFERSVDSVAKIYAVMIGLAVTESVKTLVPKLPNGQPDFSWVSLQSGLPAFIALLATAVPFWHGMNRHLDRCYLEKDSPVQGALVLDFVVFLVEATLLILAGWALRDGFITFYCLGGLLLLDVLWGFGSHQIHFPKQPSHVVSWSIINLVAGIVALGVIAYEFKWKSFLLMVIALARSIADYGFGSDFYFPAIQEET